jgi:Caspase domain
VNIAVVLGVPRYDKLPDLPGCEGDVAGVKTLLEASDKFAEVLVLDGSATYAGTKRKLGDFIGRFQSARVEEFLFYFSGHGALIEEESRLLLRDFDGDRPSTTSISNSDLDNWARSAAPELYCKIIDACHSAVPYVKDRDTLERLLDKSKSGFKACYFFYSSQYEQASFADQKLSRFTQALIESVAMYPEEAIGYNELASALADSFRSSAEQNPFFIHQAKLTEVFVSISPRMREVLEPYRSRTMSAALNSQPPVSRVSLEEKIRLDAQDYLSREEAMEFLEDLRRSMSPVAIGESIRGLYSCELSETQELTVGETRIANWLSQRSDSGFFVELDYEVYYVDTIGNVLDHAEVQSIRSQPKWTMLWLERPFYQRTRVAGFRLAETGPWEVLKLVASPNHPNLPRWELQVSYAMGPKEVAVFGGIVRLQRSGWERYKPTGHVDWVMEGAGKRDLDGGTIGSRLMEQFEERILKVISEEFDAGPVALGPAEPPNA